MSPFFGQLQPRFDNPDRVRRGAGEDACNSCRREMDVGVFLSVIEIIGNNLLAVAVGEKVDRTCGNNANQCWTETLE